MADATNQYKSEQICVHSILSAYMAVEEIMGEFDQTFSPSGYLQQSKIGSNFIKKNMAKKSIFSPKTKK